MTDEIVDADAAWPETQTNDGESECAPIIDASEPRPATLDEFGDE